MRFKDFVLNLRPVSTESFSAYFAESCHHDVINSIQKLPKKFQKLAKEYKIKFQNGHTLKGDDNNIGFINEKDKTITLASPWNYPREYALLHEIGHIIWKYIVNSNEKAEWSKIAKNTKNKQDQNDEELFCMAFADYYSHNKIVIHHHKEWENFIKKIEKES